MLHGSLVGVGKPESVARGLIGRVGDDAERVDAVTHQGRDGRIDHSMPFELRTAGECRGHQRHAVMAPLPRTRVTRMLGAVIDHLHGQRRERLLEGGAYLADGGGARMRVPGWPKKVAYHSVFRAPSLPRSRTEVPGSLLS